MAMTWECCPHCGRAVLDHLRKVWDYRSEFDTDCPHCGKRFGVKVESVPEFCCNQKTNEQRDREEWEKARAKR